MLGFDRPEADELVKKIEHVGPQEILSGASLDGAVLLKTHFEAMGLRAQIKQGRPRSTGREPIPKSVQAEVWRRDGGQCVECGSRERLEYDHIIPVRKGGSNTARNIQLLCEQHNRAKGASIV